MSGGLIQLVAYGIQDLYLTRDPQITFFKVVYRRHTNFSTEPIPQYFNFTPNFGKRSSCDISHGGDLIGPTYLVITLPEIKQTDNNCLIYNESGTGNFNNLGTQTMFAWVKKIGFAILKNIKLEIGGHIIDEQYGEWLNLWYEMFGPRERGFNKMIGNVPELITFSTEKNAYILYIPLQFWFCKTSGSYLPMISLQYTDVRITIELHEFDKCVIFAPTHYIDVYNDIINFKPLEYIEQNIDGNIASGIFINYDYSNKRMYYVKTSQADFQSINTESTNLIDQTNQIFNLRNKKYFIRGTETGYSIMPQFSAVPHLNGSNNTLNLTNTDIIDCFLLIEYVYLDEEERVRFMQTKNDYLIEQITYINEKTIESPNRIIHVDLLQPCKLLVWVAQLSYFIDINDTFNYTDRFVNTYSNFNDDEIIEVCDKRRIMPNSSFILRETIRLNGLERLSKRDYKYFNYVQPYQHCTYSPSEGINIYSFALFPQKFQPSGSCNMSQIDNVEIDLTMKYIVSIQNQAKFRAYALSLNILRIVNGLAGLVFTR